MKHITRPKLFFVQKFFTRNIYRFLFNKVILSFILGMLCLELISNFVLDIEWPSDKGTESKVYPVDREDDYSYLSDPSTEETSENDTAVSLEKALRRLAQMEKRISGLRNLTADDILDIQEGRKLSRDPALLDHIRRQLVFPSNSTLNLTDPLRSDFSQAGQSSYIDLLLHSKRKGFFIECGAGNGEDMSDTLYLERHRGWTGLLLEPHPYDFKQLLYKRRNAWALNACASPTGSSSIQVLRASRGYISGLRGYVDNLHKGTDFTKHMSYQGDVFVQCYDFSSLLGAIGIQEVDYLSLNAGGAELDILKTIPLDMVRVNTLSIEYRAQGSRPDKESRSLAKLAQIRDIMARTGFYNEVGILLDQPEVASAPDLKFREKYGLDVVFKRKDYDILRAINTLNIKDG